MNQNKGIILKNEEEMLQLAKQLSSDFSSGDTVLLEGPLGAGKTTFVRCLLRAYGYEGPVRSPTFNLIQVFNTSPPIMHADLYRVESYKGIGIEEYLDTHLCLIEWPDRAAGLISPEQAWQIKIDFHKDGRILFLKRPEYHSAQGCTAPS